jgi:hypothetical protein
MKYALVTVLALLGVAVAAPVANAAQTLDVTSRDSWGFETRAPEGWEVTNCYGAGGYNASGVRVTTASYYNSEAGPRYAYFEFDNGYSPTVVRVRATCDLQRSDTEYRREWRWKTKTRTGTNTSSRARSSGCYFDGYSGSLQLDCWGGSYAEARYRFSLPADARNVSRSISGSINCCRPGTASRRWSGNTAIVHVTNWRAYTVRRVTIDYQTKVTVPYNVTHTDVGTVS